MKLLKSSHRENKRYLFISGKDANKKNIEEVILEFIGVLGYANTCPKFININNKSSDKIILAINVKSLDLIRTSFIMSKKDIKINRVSGTLKKLKN